MPFDYSDRDASLSRAAALTQTGISAAALLEVGYKLDDSAALLGVVLYYRPQYTAAIWLHQNRNDQAVTAADGAKFTNLKPVIESLLREQQSLDIRFGWTVPLGYETGTLLDSLCGCSTGGQAGGTSIASMMAV